jgi:hypothetical protein
LGGAVASLFVTRCEANIVGLPTRVASPKLALPARGRR